MSRSTHSVARRARIQVALTPETLLRAGILGDPDNPAQAYRRARRLAGQGRFGQARALVLPHVHRSRGLLALRIKELLARCAIRGAGNEWELLLQETVEGYRIRRDEPRLARARARLGEVLVSAGRFREADQHLRAAETSFRQQGQTTRAAMVLSLRARARLRAGFIGRAATRMERAIEQLSAGNDSRALARARLDRARISAWQGRQRAAAQDLVAAEQVLGGTGVKIDQIRVRVARAECLYVLDRPQRAARGLKTILGEVDQLEDVSMRAWVHALLGLSLADTSPAMARQYLIRGRHLFQQLKRDYSVVRCDIALAQVEHRMRLNPRGRLQRLATQSFRRWPLLAAYFNVARAQMSLSDQTDRAVHSLLRTRAFAVENQNLFLWQQIDGLLHDSGRVAHLVLDPPLKLSERQTSVSAPDSGALPRPYPIGDLSPEQIVIGSRPRSSISVLGDAVVRPSNEPSFRWQR